MPEAADRVKAEVVGGITRVHEVGIGEHVREQDKEIAPSCRLRAGRSGAGGRGTSHEERKQRT